MKHKQYIKCIADEERALRLTARYLLKDSIAGICHQLATKYKRLNTNLIYQISVKIYPAVAQFFLVQRAEVEVLKIH